MGKIVMIDMDDTMADFQGHELFNNQKELKDVSHMYDHGFFLSLQPMPGALFAIRSIINMGYDVHILTQPVAESAHSYSEKVQWIGKWFPELVKKINMTQDKGLVKGDFLIDDNMKKWKEKFETNGGKFIHFQYHRHNKAKNRESWEYIVDYLRHHLESEK